MLLASTFLAVIAPPGAQAQVDKPVYPTMAPLDQYLITDRNSEIELARSAAPASIAQAAEIKVLERNGYTTAVKGSNDFVCIVERSWAKSTSDPEFWSPKVRAPNCFNTAAKPIVDLYLMKTDLVLAGKTRAEVLDAVSSALDRKQIAPLELGAMCYMMSKQQYLNDQGLHWHPHLMFFVSGDAEASWGANLPKSPILASQAPEQRLTTFMVVVNNWSDGAPFESTVH